MAFFRKCVSRKLGIFLKNAKNVLIMADRKNNINGLNWTEKSWYLRTVGNTSNITRMIAGITESGATDVPPKIFERTGKLLTGRSKNIAPNMIDAITERN